MADETGSSYLRLQAPQHQMYDTSEGEQSVLRNITPQTMAAMYPFLLNARAMAGSNQAAYRDQLSLVNAQQSALAAAKLNQDELINRRKTGVDLLQHGGAGMLHQPALRALFDQNQGGMESILRSDTDMHNTREATALEKRGAGMLHLSDAGIQVDPGQQVGSLDADGLAALRASTHRPVAIEKALIDANGQITAAGLRAAGTNGDQEIVRGNTAVPGALDLEVRSRVPGRAMSMAQQRMPQLRTFASDMSRGGGTQPPPAPSAGTAAPTGTMTWADANRRANILPDAKPGYTVSRQTVPGQPERWIGRNPDGSSFVVR